MQLNIEFQSFDIPIDAIVPSPYQARKGFDEGKLKELAQSLKVDGLIHPIAVREKDGGFELLAGERRLRSAKLLGWKTIRGEIRNVDDFQARKIALSENIQRIDLTPIEEIEAFALWIDVLMCDHEEYAKIARPPLERVTWLLQKLHSDVINDTDYFINKFINKIEEAFKSLPKPVEWESFYVNDLFSYVRMDEDVKDVAIEKKLRKSQAKALQQVKKKAPEKFEEIKQTGQVKITTKSGKEEVEQVEEVSSRELETIAKQNTKKAAVQKPIEIIRIIESLTIINSSAELMDGELVDIAGQQCNIDDNSVHLVITSPPYNNATAYDGYDDNLSQDEYFALLRNVFSLCYLKLVKGGRIAINLPNITKTDKFGQHFLIFDVWQILTDIGFLPREYITWIKLETSSDASVVDSFTALLAKSTAWGSWVSAKNPSLRSISESIIVMHKEQTALEDKEEESTITDEEFRLWTSNVWFFPGSSSQDHPAVFPLELADRLVKLYSYKGCTILDPFMGLGTTGMACKGNRRFIGFDISERYCNGAYERIGHFSISEQ